MEDANVTLKKEPEVSQDLSALRGPRALLDVTATPVSRGR